ncbi:unnamed protein product [Phaedon cochleariae]|uniref:Uncharacterized protein n=1 Tax=Phaedon cochleariae TaxID=80249 RepID=A0A9P0GMA3_PHACE|nr:unnamed protein product [Phaedon cochleariae]
MTGRTRTGSITEQMDDKTVEMIISKLAPKLTAKIESQFEKLSKHFEQMEAKINSLVDKLTSIEEVAESNKVEIKSMNDRMDKLEQKLKSNTLRIIGLDEEPNENLIAKVSNLLNNVLKVPCTQQDFNNIYRTGKIKNQTKPRTIMISFISHMKRNQIYAAKKLLKGTNMYINEDLTKLQYSLYGIAKNKFGNKNVWSSNGRILARVGTDVKSIEKHMFTIDID